jgi:hypothetical protein
MDIAKHKKEMEGLLKFVKAKEEDPNADVALPENYKLTSQQPKEKTFEYNRLRELAEYMNRNYDAYAVSDDEGFIAKFNEYKKELIEMSSELPWDLFEMENYLNVLHSIPKGLSQQDKHGFTSALECSQCVEESGELWKTEPFNDVLLDLKAASLVEFNSANGISACIFSFTDKVWDENYDIQGIISDIGKLNKFDIDNMLLLALVNFKGVEEGDFDEDDNYIAKYEFPENFEDIFIESIIETGYTFKYYDEGSTQFIEPFRNEKLNRIADFLETRSDERLVTK